MSTRARTKSRSLSGSGTGAARCAPPRRAQRHDRALGAPRDRARATWATAALRVPAGRMNLQPRQRCVVVRERAVQTRDGAGLEQLVKPGIDSSPPRLNSSCWMTTSSSRTSPGSGSASSTPSAGVQLVDVAHRLHAQVVFWRRGCRPRSGGAVVPVRVAICVRRLAMAPDATAAHVRSGHGRRGTASPDEAHAVGEAASPPRRPASRRASGALPESTHRPSAPGSDHECADPWTPAARRRAAAHPADHARRLRARFGDRCSTATAVREQHGRDESPFATTPPEAVVFCESTTTRWPPSCAWQQSTPVPVIPYGTGSSLEGHLLAVQGGISIDVSGMNRVRPQPRGPDGHGAGRRDARAAQPRDPRHGPVLPHRSGREREPRRHGGHAGQRHERGALRHDARERARLTVVTASGEVIRTGTPARSPAPATTSRACSSAAKARSA